jgi:hypothetical protein
MGKIGANRGRGWLELDCGGKPINAFRLYSAGGLKAKELKNCGGEGREQGDWLQLKKIGRRGNTWFVFIVK